MALLVTGGIVAWWLVLAHKSRQVAQEESNRQTNLLQLEIASHRQTDKALQDARVVAENARQAADDARQAADDARVVAVQARQAADDARLVADQANQAKSRYISAISHELRTPLNSILGYAQLMGEDATVPPHRQQAVSVIRRGGEHLLSLIEGTLDIARIESGKLSLNIKPMQFADLIHEICDMFEPQAKARGLQFVFEPEGTLPEVVRADEKRLRQILINLLGNAIKFTANGQVSLRVRYAREMAQVEIADTGPGLSTAELASIFEPFERGAHGAIATPGHPATGGAGLGLTIAKMLTDLMGGEMTVSSTPGEGAVFRIKLFLPELHVGSGGTKAAILPASRRLPRAYEGVRRKILVVDNEEPDRDLLIQLLTPIGFEVRSAASGHDALDLLAAGYRPDVIFMDLAMPGIDGWETIRRIRAPTLVTDVYSLPPGGAVPPWGGPAAGRADVHAIAHIAIVSANAFDKGQDNDVGIRPEDFIVKPVRHSELLDWLERRLQLVWVADPVLQAAIEEAAKPPVAEPAPGVLVRPNDAVVQALLNVVGLGYYRGVMNKLDEIESSQPETADFVKPLRALARQFQFDAIIQRLAHEPETR